MISGQPPEGCVRDTSRILRGGWPSLSYFAAVIRFFIINGLTYPPGSTRSGSGRTLRYVT